jgi:hypothetical protein
MMLKITWNFFHFFQPNLSLEIRHRFPYLIFYCQQNIKYIVICYETKFCQTIFWQDINHEFTH